DPRLAWEALARAFAEDPQEASTLGELERLTDKLGRFPDLVKVIERAAEALFDPEVQAQLFARVAEHQTTRLGDPAGAIAAWRRALAIRDDDAVALLAIEQLLAGQAQWEELAQVIDRRAELADDPAERKALLYR